MTTVLDRPSVTQPRISDDEIAEQGSDYFLSILVPVLGRPHAAMPLVESIRLSTREWDPEIVFLCSPDDLDQRHASEETGERVVTVTWDPGDGDYARKINAGFSVTRSPWILTAADDLTFDRGWDTEFLRLVESARRVLGTNDMANPTVKRGRHSTHTFVRRDYVDDVGATFVDGPGVVLHEGYKHQWVDTELVEAARIRREWAWGRDCIIRHHHPFFDKTVEMDETYRKALSGSDHDSRLYRRRRSTMPRAPR